MYDDKGLKLNLADDGKGFVLGDINTITGIGLDNMKRRADLISGELLLKSSPGRGTNLDLFIPAENII